VTRRDARRVGIETSDSDLVPQGHRFDVVWRGYHRRQVNEYVDLALGWLTADRNTAVNMVYELALQLDECRSEALRLRQRVDQLCREPMDPDAVAERLRRYVQIARAEASDVVTKARARADHIRTGALDEARRQEAAAERRRQLAEEDFQLAMTARRAEAVCNLRTYEQACRAEADRLVRDARADAARRLTCATEQVEALHRLRDELARRLRLAHGLFLRASAFLED
jgi:colicin import membrane protein